MAKKKQEKPRRETTRRQRSHWKKQKRRQRIIFGAAILILAAVLSVIGVGVYNSWYVEDYKPLHETVLEVNGTKFDMEYYTNMLVYVTAASGLSLEYASFMTDSTLEAIKTNELMLQAAAELGITISDDELEEAVADSGLDEKYWDIIRVQLMGQKLLAEYFDEQVPQYAPQRYVMAMFLESEAQANEVAARLDAGEDFTTLAAEFSLDSGTKEVDGDFGWLPRGILPLMVSSETLETIAFNAEVGVLSSPIFEETKTKSVGYWLIKVMSADASAEPAEADVRVMLLGSEQEANDIIARLDAGEDFSELAAEYSRHTASKEEGGELFVNKDTMTAAFDEYVFDPEVELETLSPPIRDDEITTEGGYWLVMVTEADDNRQIDDEDRDMLKSKAFNQWVEELVTNPDNEIVSYLDDEKKNWAVSYIMGG